MAAAKGLCRCASLVGFQGQHPQPHGQDRASRQRRRERHHKARQAQCGDQSGKACAGQGRLLRVAGEEAGIVGAALAKLGD